jgi:Fic family protein
MTVRLFERLPTHPIVTSASVMRLLITSRPTAGRALDALVDAGILVETTGKRRDRTFAYEGYLQRLREGTEVGGE